MFMRCKVTVDTSHYRKEGPWELPNGWVWCNLEELCFFLSRGKSPVYSDDSKEYPVFAQKCNLKEGGISLEKALFLNPETLPKWPIEYRLKTGDVLVNSTGTGTVGRTRLFNEQALGPYPFVVPDSHVSVIRTFSQISSEYVYILLSSEYGQQYFADNLAGSTNQKELYIASIAELQFPLPPEEEQRRIAKQVFALEDSIKNLDEEKLLIKSCVESAKAKILELAIHGKLVSQDPSDEPAINLLRRINPNFTPSHNLHYETQHLFALPKGWEWCSVKEYTKKVTDFVASGSFASLKENVRYYKSPNYAILVKTKDFANNFSEDLTYTDEHGYHFLENSHLFGGELLFSNVGSVGKIFKVPKLNMRMSLAPNAIMVKFQLDEQSTWFERVFESPFGQESLRAIASATAIMKFNKTDFGKLLIPVPPVSEQKRILNAIDALFAQLDCIYDTE